jgi:hypothetical protein
MQFSDVSWMIDDLLYKYKQYSYKCDGQRAVPTTQQDHLRRCATTSPTHPAPRPLEDKRSGRPDATAQFEVGVSIVLLLTYEVVDQLHQLELVHRTGSSRRCSLIVVREHVHSPLVLCVALALAPALAPLVELELVLVVAGALDTLATPPPAAIVPPVVVPDGGVPPSSSPSPSPPSLLPDELDVVSPGGWDPSDVAPFELDASAGAGAGVRNRNPNSCSSFVVVVR